MALSEEEKAKRRAKYQAQKAAVESPTTEPNIPVQPIYTDAVDQRLESLKETIAERSLPSSHRVALTVDKIDGYWHCIEYTIKDDQVVDVNYGEQMLRADAFNKFKIRAARKLFGIVPVKPGDE